MVDEGDHSVEVFCVAPAEQERAHFRLVDCDSAWEEHLLLVVAEDGTRARLGPSQVGRLQVVRVDSRSWGVLTSRAKAEALATRIGEPLPAMRLGEQLAKYESKGVFSKGLQIDLDSVALLPEVVEMIPAEVAEALQVMPVARAGETLIVACARVMHPSTVDFIARATGCSIQMCVCDAAALRLLLGKRAVG